MNAESSTGSQMRAPVADHVAGAFVDVLNQARFAAEQAAHAGQDRIFTTAMGEVQKVYEFLLRPENILGSEKTKHGEIAEQVQVGISNARDMLDGNSPSHTFDNVGRTAPEDYKVGGLDVQSKFINGTRNTLDHVKGHAETYPSFIKAGGYYHVPNDQFKQMSDVAAGIRPNEMSEKTFNTLARKIAEIEKATGRSFDDVVRPGISDYKDIQTGKVHETLEGHKKDLENRNEAKHEEIAQDHKPGLSDAAKATAGAAAVAAAFSFTTGAYQKWRHEGKNIFKGDLTVQDWKELGLDTLKGGAIGAVTGAALFALTNFGGLAAPLASAFVTASKGMTPLITQYEKGEIGIDELLDQGTFVCSDVAIVGLAGVIGQSVIPIPILGALLGSLTGKFLSSILSKHIKGAAEKLKARSDAVYAALDKAYEQLIEEIETKFKKLGDLAKAAFDFTANLQLAERSLDFARAVGVPEEKLIKSESELFAFMKS